jgi:hypothetical protein
MRDDLRLNRASLSPPDPGCCRGDVDIADHTLLHKYSWSTIMKP